MANHAPHKSLIKVTALTNHIVSGCFPSTNTSLGLLGSQTKVWVCWGVKQKFGSAGESNKSLGLLESQTKVWVCWGLKQKFGSAGESNRSLGLLGSKKKTVPWVFIFRFV